MGVHPEVRKSYEMALRGAALNVVLNWDGSDGPMPPDFALSFASEAIKQFELARLEAQSFVRWDAGDWSPSRDLPGSGRHFVYNLLDDDENTVYVGVTSNLRQRLKAHYKDPTKASVTQWHAIEFKSRRAADASEEHRIFVLQPPLNKAGLR